MKLKLLTAIVLLLQVFLFNAYAETDTEIPINLQPKYGGVQKTPEMLAADEKFLTEIDKIFNGDRIKASKVVAQRGWDYLRAGRSYDAMHSFNRAWLLNPSNGKALWGMAAYYASRGDLARALPLYAEAKPLMADDTDFAADYAKASSTEAMMKRDGTLMQKSSLNAHVETGTEIPINLQPKYGGVQKTPKMLAADEKFLADMDKMFNGDRKQASYAVAQRGWDYFRAGQSDDAMRRYNQAWLLNPSNGAALWGMAVYLASRGDIAHALPLFAEAKPLVGDEIDFAIDQAKASSAEAMMKRDGALMQNVLAQFAEIDKRAPNHVMNLQNWAIALYSIGEYGQAWGKIKRAEKISAKELDANFIADLEKQMPRP